MAEEKEKEKEKDDHLGIEIRSSWEKKLANLGLDDTSLDYPETIPFFVRRNRRKKNTWVISLIVVLSLVVFLATMYANDCSSNSNGDCVLRSLGRFSFQRMRENPFLGPSSSTLVRLGALRWAEIVSRKQHWRIATCLWLHAGVLHLIINLSSVLFIGIHLENDLGPLRTGIVYFLSASSGSLISAVFVQNIPTVGASNAQFGLIGATIADLLVNWSIYEMKFTACIVISAIAFTNFLIGFLPHVDVFANIGSLISGFMLGFVFVTDPRNKLRKQKRGLYNYDAKFSEDSKFKFDKLTMRIVALLIFLLWIACLIVVFLYGVNVNKYCRWCHYLNCAPLKFWSCNVNFFCKSSVRGGRLKLTCLTNGKFRTFPNAADISKGRMEDLCNQICS